MRRLLAEPGRFTVLAEVVPWRGTLSDGAGARARRFAAELQDVPGVDVVSVTDGAGGRLVLSPEALAAELAAAGQRVLVHVTCRDRNRNELAALAWRLAGAGLTDLLVLTGDYPHEGYLGVARPVFDLDSVSLLQLYATLGGPDAAGAVLARPAPGGRRPGVGAAATVATRARGPRGASPLHLGVAVNPYKTLARDAVPQYLKLELKARAGARFAVTQAGFDVRRLHELARYVADRGLPLRLLASVYVLSAGAARAFHAGRVPGVSLSDALLAEVERHAAGPDRGRAFFLELAARQVAVVRGLGYAGVCLSGLSEAADVARVLELAEAFGAGDGGWRDLLPGVTWPDPGDFWWYPPDPDSGLTGPPAALGPGGPHGPGGPGGSGGAGGKVAGPRAAGGGRRSPTYAVGRLVHEAVFVPGTRRFDLAGRIVRGSQRLGLGPALHAAEQAIKRPLYGCQDCGDCSLPDLAFLCPESQCAKNQRNGPCGGSSAGRCELPGRECVWARAYQRLAPSGRAAGMLDRPVAVQDHALRHTSSWANALTGQDLHARRAEPGVLGHPVVPVAPAGPVAPPGPDRTPITALDPQTTAAASGRGGPTSS